MTTATLRHWVAKDWALNRFAIAVGLLGAMLSLVLVAWPSEGLFYLGSVLLITMVVGTGFTIIMITVVQERTERTLPFVMSMPISVADYTVTKLVANLLLFLIPWLLITLGTVGVILVRPTLPDGLVPYAVLLLVELLVGYILVLGIALVTESLGWTIASVVVTNLGIQAFMYYTGKVSAIVTPMQGEAIAWSSAASKILAAELAVIVLVLIVTWQVQSRKREFL